MAARKILRRRVIGNIFIPNKNLDSQTEISLQEYSVAQQTFTVFVSSWNVGGVVPPDNLNLEELLDTENTITDIYVLGFQEIVPLNAGNILAPENSHISSKWNSLIKAALNKRSKLVVNEEEEETQKAPQKADGGGEATTQRIHPVKMNSNAMDWRSTRIPELEFECIISKQMVGLFITVWARRDLCAYITHPTASCVGCGILGRLGNKGSVSISFRLHETSFCFVCCHLASGGKEGDERQRNTNVADILTRTVFPAPQRNHHHPLPTKILHHDRIIWLGDLNYRIYLPEATTQSLVKNKEWRMLLRHDQLKAELAKGRVFEGWHEEEIEFAPTYKYDQNSDDYYGSSHNMKATRKRSPAWCDRIIWFGKGLKQIQYSRVESRLSDHRPVRAIFIARAKES
ncbi:type IV inositol polyphosphate 5-phosphatase 9-like [Andrographis paniculata]|uniref:type IV inositol polyphosphate 5-phosphatase 9-like n=1 Tax=Andrographis paniculata TaxID=175694 RepID=UPI0021E720EF|nr:type IV inositol polyphosphate 5-phosphatase 9-like [Andrographis paniculata]